MAQFEEDKKSSQVEDAAGKSSGPAPLSSLIVPGLSYIPDKIEIAEDPILLAKLSYEMLDFIKILSQLLDLIWLIKPKHLRSMNPVPALIIEDLLQHQGKGPRLKALEAKLTEPHVVASPSVETVLKAQTHQPGASPRLRETYHSIGSNMKAGFPFANDLLEITGKRTRPLWQSVMLEKPEELSILKPKPKKQDSYVFSVKTTYKQCKANEELARTKSETRLFSIKFAWNDKYDPALTADPKFQKQVEMMVAAQAGFRTVEEHMAYLSTLKSHWYNNFLNDTIKLGVFTCHEMVEAFEALAKHYHMNYNSNPLAKAKLCLIVMSLPFWDIGRIETQRAVEFILEKILLLPDKPLIEWLRYRGIPYVVCPPFSAEDYLNHSSQEHEDDAASAVGEDEKKVSQCPTVENSTLAVND